MSELQNKINRALEYHKAGRFPEAEIIYRGVLDEDPDNLNALNLFGVLLYQLKQYDHAAEVICHAIELTPSAYSYKNLGNVFLDKGDTEQAVQNFRQALLLDPEDTSLYFSIGFAYKKLKQYEHSVAYYEKAVELKPNLPQAYYNLGNIYKEMENMDEAVSNYQKALLLKPNDVDILVTLARILKDRKQNEEAIKFYQRAIEAKPHMEDVLVELAEMYVEANEIEKARVTYEMVIEANPNNELACFKLGNLFEEEDLEAAIMCYQRALEINPAYADAYQSLTLALYNRSQRQ